VKNKKKCLVLISPKTPKYENKMKEPSKPKNIKIELKIKKIKDLYC
jgi:hypothetical protein